MTYNAPADGYTDVIMIALVMIGITNAVMASGFTWPVACGEVGQPVCQHYGPYPGCWAAVAVCAAGLVYIAYKHWPRGDT